jgi:uncharacterized protein YlxP (DUF503 family)
VGSEPPVYVGVLSVRFDTPFVRSLKEKRSLIKPVTEGLKVRFPLSVARLDGLDEHDWERIGAAAIAADPVWLRGMLDRALAWVAAKGVPISASWVEIDVWDGFESQP